MPTHKSGDYKLSAVEYYLTEDKSKKSSLPSWFSFKMVFFSNPTITTNPLTQMPKNIFYIFQFPNMHPKKSSKTISKNIEIARNLTQR